MPQGAHRQTSGVCRLAYPPVSLSHFGQLSILALPGIHTADSDFFRLLSIRSHRITRKPHVARGAREKIAASTFFCPSKNRPAKSHERPSDENRTGKHPGHNKTPPSQPPRRASEPPTHEQPHTAPDRKPLPTHSPQPRHSTTMTGTIKRTSPQSLSFKRTLGKTVCRSCSTYSSTSSGALARSSKNCRSDWTKKAAALFFLANRPSERTRSPRDGNSDLHRYSVWNMADWADSA